MTERRRIYRLPWSYDTIRGDLDILPAHEGFQPAVVAHDLQLGDTPLHAEGPILDIWRQRRHLLYTCDPGGVPANALNWRLGDPTWVGPLPAWQLVPLARLAEWDTPPVPPKVGDIITDAAALEALPAGAMIRASFVSSEPGQALRRIRRSPTGPMIWTRTGTTAMFTSQSLVDEPGVIEILWLPS